MDRRRRKFVASLKTSIFDWLFTGIILMLAYGVLVNAYGFIPVIKDISPFGISLVLDSPARWIGFVVVALIVGWLAHKAPNWFRGAKVGGEISG